MPAAPDYSLEIVENSGQPQRPALMILPGLTSDVEVYDKRMIPLRIL